MIIYGKFRGALSKASLLSAAVLWAILTHPYSAYATCGDNGHESQCRSDFENLSAVAWTGDGFAAAGKFKNAPSGIALLRLTSKGESKGVVKLPRPVTASSSRAVEAHRLIALPAGAVVLLGALEASDGRQTAFAMKVAATDRIVWSKTFPSPVASTVFHSGYYDANADRVIAVGRVSPGADDRGRCINWSQSLLISLNAKDGTQDSVFVQGAQAAGSTNRQAIYDITSGEMPDSYVIAGFSTANASAKGKCKDNIFIGTLRFIEQKWVMSGPNTISGKNAGQGAFAVRPAGPRTYLLAGYGQDPTGGVAAAQAYRVKLAPFMIEKVLSTPFAGGARFRSIVPLLDKEHFLFAGSASVRSGEPAQAIWQVAADGLTKNDPLTVLKGSLGSEILDAAMSPQGMILMVGKWSDDEGQAGLIRLIQGATLEPQIRFSRRAPDAHLPRLSSLQVQNNTYYIAGAPSAGGYGFYGADLSAGEQIDIRLSFPKTVTLKMSTLTASGDLDILISDHENRPLAFSNFAGFAPELLIVTLLPGDYTVSVIAVTPVNSYELKLSPFPNDVETFNAPQLLNDEQRTRLADALTQAGFGPPSEPNIALGGESIRALLSAREAAPTQNTPPYTWLLQAR
jgi:hypothetical protein